MSRRLKRYQVSHALLAALFETGNVIKPARVINGLPKEATVCRVMSDTQRDCSVFVVQSAEFDEVPEGEPIPLADLTFEQLRNER